MPNFVLLGAAGFVAPRHMKAIKEVGGNLVAALDPHDSVGRLDSYFPDCEFFTEFERFDRHCEKLRRSGTKIDYVSIASPNYLHDSHCRFALRIGADAICEKPLVTHEHNLDALADLEAETGRRIWTLLQLRYHPLVRDLKASLTGDWHKAIVNYVTPRGEWYLQSWKGNTERSGGLATNIGIHLFDLLTYLFGSPGAVDVECADDRNVAGRLELERAFAWWNLSIDKGLEPQRVFQIDGQDIELSGGFTDLHTESYRQILAGNGFGIEDARAGVIITQKIREMT